MEFFREARRALAPGGVFVLSLFVDPGAQEEMILRAGVVGATLAAVFRRVVVTPAGFAVADVDDLRQFHLEGPGGGLDRLVVGVHGAEFQQTGFHGLDLSRASGARRGSVVKASPERPGWP